MRRNKTKVIPSCFRRGSQKSRGEEARHLCPQGATTHRSHEMRTSLPPATWDGGRVSLLPHWVGSDGVLERIRWAFVQPGCTNRLRLEQYFTTISTPELQ